jgi:hypothetical protein
MKKSIVVVETVNNEAIGDYSSERVECGDTQISSIAAKSLVEPLEACRPQESLKTKVPKHPEVLGKAMRRAPHREAFIPVVKSWVSRADWQGFESTPTSGRSCIRGTQLGWQSRRHTVVLQDLGI